MTPKKTSLHKRKGIIAKKPSPRKMSRSPAVSAKARRSSQEVLKKTKRLSSHDSSVESELSDAEKPTTPRSSERYLFRKITPPSYKLTGHYTPARTPLRTPAGIPPRTPGNRINKAPVATPFKTPRIKPLGRETHDPAEAFRRHEDEAVTWEEHLKLITSKMHKLCYLSSMSNFRYADTRLRKKYENYLKNKVLDVYPSAMLTVSLSTTSCLTLQPSAVDAVRIEISSLNIGDGDDEDETVNVYRAWLFRSSKTQTRSIDEMEWFPVMFYSGKEVIHNVVIDWLQGSFGCYVSRFGIRQYDLMWIAGAWSGRLCPLAAHQKRKNLRVDLLYYFHPPAGMNNLPSPNKRGKPRIAMSLSLTDIQHVWMDIVDSSSEHIKEEELSEYFTTMDSLAERMTMIPRYLLQLYKLQTPCINLSADGKVRVPCKRSVRVIVNHLIDLFMHVLNVQNDTTNESTNEMIGDFTASLNKAT